MVKSWQRFKTYRPDTGLDHQTFTGLTFINHEHSWNVTNTLQVVVTGILNMTPCWITTFIYILNWWNDWGRWETTKSQRVRGGNVCLSCRHNNLSFLLLHWHVNIFYHLGMTTSNQGAKLSSALSLQPHFYCWNCGNIPGGCGTYLCRQQQGQQWRWRVSNFYLN